MNMQSGDDPDLDLSDLLAEEKLEKWRGYFEKQRRYNEQQVKSGKTPISSNHLLIVDWWHRVAREEEHFPREFLKFISLWEAFNGLINCRLHFKKRKKLRDRGKMLGLSNDVLIVEGWRGLLHNDNFNKLLDELCAYCPVNQVLGGERTIYYTIKKPYELDDVLKLIYAIRCNLFHGEKEARERDLRLVDVASGVFCSFGRTGKRSIKRGTSQIKRNLKRRAAVGFCCAQSS